MSGAASKPELRGAVQAWRRRLTPDAVLLLSERIQAHLRAWPPLLGSRCVLAFVPLPREPQVGPLLELLAGRGARLFVPRVRGDTLIVGEWRPSAPVPAGVPEEVPSAGDRSTAEDVADRGADLGRIDLALVPGLAFDVSGGRLGRGGGHYDRLLPRLRADCLRVGVCFGGQLLPRVPRDAWDQAVDFVATEDGLHTGVGRGVTPGQSDAERR